jgi:hypothetical protein
MKLRIPYSPILISILACLTLGTATSIPIAAQTCQPQHPGAQSLNQPIGFGGNINTLAIQFFDANGNPLGNIQTPGMTWLDPNQIHIGAGFVQGIPGIPLIYNSLDNGGMLKKSVHGSADPLAPSTGLIALAGAEGHAIIAYSVIHPEQATGSGSSSLYAAEFTSISDTPAVLTRSEDDSFVIYPLSVHHENGDLRGIWYTLSMWGIGHILFPPFGGLYYLNVDDGQVTEFLPSTDRLVGFSPDQTIAANIRDADSSQKILTLKDLSRCQETDIPFNSSTNLGAGFITFSPDNQYLAWLEASGPSNMEAQMRLRVARTTGDILRDALFQELSSLAGGQNAVYIKPLGWLANHLLLLEISAASQNYPSVVAWAPDTLQPLNPALGANQSAVLAEGVFAGFLYP